MRGMLAFNKVGFQTHRDRACFLDLVKEHFPQAKIDHNQATDKDTITYEGISSSVGVFPVSIKNEEFLDVANDPKSVEMEQEIRQRLMGERDGKFFFSVERFDYTKGIKEKLMVTFWVFPCEKCASHFFFIPGIQTILRAAPGSHRQRLSHASGRDQSSISRYISTISRRMRGFG